MYGEAYRWWTRKYWFLQIRVPQAFSIFDSDGNGEIDIGKTTLSNQILCLCMELSNGIQNYEIPPNTPEYNYFKPNSMFAYGTIQWNSKL